MYSHKFLSDEQHGFLSRRSTCTNLLESLDDWTLNLDSKSDTIAAYIDFAKAFDSVSIPKLLYKLSHYGVRGNVLSCMKSFLTNRTQRVKVGSTFSLSQEVVSGVPQGSVLGPILFIIFINDITDSLPLKVCTKLFADDLKSYVQIDNMMDIDTFKSALEHFSAWSKDWQLPVSCSKSTWMRFSNKTATDVSNDFYLSGQILSESHENKDLGVLFDCNLSFATYITSITGKAKQRLYLLNKSFITKDPDTLIFAFKTYILPILDYCSPIWSPWHIADITRIESVQRLFTKKLLGYELLSYKERLTKSGLCGLELRRVRADLILCYKILHGFVRIKTILELDPSNLTRGHCWKLKAVKPRLDTRLHFFQYRVVKIWNKLKAETVCSTTLSSFIVNLLKEDLSLFLKCSFN